MFAHTKPTSPGPSSRTSTPSGLNTPSLMTSKCRPEEKMRIWSPFLMRPSRMRNSTTTPMYESYQESKISALRGASASPFGGGSMVTMRSMSSATPRPLLALTREGSVQSSPMTSSISLATRSGSALGRSILLSTGSTSRSLSSARYTLARVCASTPWDASTTSSAPSQAASERETS